MRLHYKHQLVYEVKGNSLCLLRESHKYKYVGKMQSEYLGVKKDDTLRPSNHCFLNG